MEESRNALLKQEKSKAVINIGKAGGGGGGIGFGIVFLGGAVATAAFLIRKRLRKSSDGKHSNHAQSTAPSEIPYKFLEDKNINEDKGLHFDAPDPSPNMDMDKNLSDGTAEAKAPDNDNSMTSDQSFFLDQQQKFKANGRKEDSIFDGGEIIHFNYPKVLDSSMQFDASAMKEVEFPLPVVDRKMLLQSTDAEENLSAEEIEIIKEADEIGTALVDQGMEEDNRHMLVNIEGEEMKTNCCDHDQEAAETSEADQSMLIILQSSEAQENTIHCGPESNSTGGSLPRTTMFVGQGSFLPKPDNSSLCKDEKLDSLLAFETVEIPEKDEVIEAAHADKDKGDHDQKAAETSEADQNMLIILQSSEKQENPIHCGPESNSTGSSLPRTTLFVGQGSFLPVPDNSSLCKDEKLDSQEGLLAFETFEIPEKDEALEAAHADQDKGDTMTQIIEVEGSANTANFEVKKINEQLEAIHEERVNGNAPILIFVEEENKCDQHDCSLTTEAVEVLEEVKVLEEAEGKGISDILLVGEEKGTQICAEITGEESHATGETVQLPDDIASGSNHKKLQNEEPETSPNGDQEDNTVSHGLISDDSPSENCGVNTPKMSLSVFNTQAHLKHEIGIDNCFTEVQWSAEASEVRKENMASQPATEDKIVEIENLPEELVEKHLNDGNGITLEEVEDTFLMKYADNVTIEEHNLMMPEEDIMDNEADEANIAVKVEESSEGTENSSLESNAEPNWSADEANMTEKVEVSSDETGDSSVESNSEPIWPAESIQEVSPEPKELKPNYQKEKQQEEKDQTVKTHVHMYLKNVDRDGIPENSLQRGNDDKGNLKMPFLEKYMLELAEQINQPTNSYKWRVLLLIVLVLSWCLCFLRFGLPFLKICLMVVLIKILSKLHGI